MKIIYLISGMFKSGGIERVITNKANYFVEQGNTVIIVTTDQSGRDYFFPLDKRVQRKDLGLNYDRFDGMSTLRRYWETYKLKKKHQRLLTDLLLEERADIVVSVWRQEVTFLPSIKDGSRKILELHSSKLTPILMYPPEAKARRLFGFMRIKIQERIASTFDRLVILTEEELPLWSNLKSVEVIPNGLSFSTPDKPNLDAHRLIAVGRMEYQKNFPELLQIWATVAPSFPEWTLHIYGNGWMMPQLKAQADDLGISGRVSFEGATLDVQSAYLSSSVFLMTSHYEGLPMVLLEAQAAGLPAVCYACPSGTKDIIRDGENGFLVPSYNRELFADRLKELMTNEDLRKSMGRKAKELSQRFSENSVMERWKDLFDRLLTQR